MTKNNLLQYLNRNLRKIRLKMHKKNKHWVVISLATLTLVSGGVLVSTYGTNIKSQLNVANANTQTERKVSSSDDKLPLHQIPKDMNSQNDLRISHKTGKSEAEQSGKYDSQSNMPLYDFQNHFKEYQYPAYNGIGYAGQNEGSPFHQGINYYPFPSRIINNNSFDLLDIGEGHGALEYENLQENSGVPYVMKATLPKHEPNPNKVLTIKYPHSVRMKVSTGNKGHQKTVWGEAYVQISQIQYYSPWNQRPSIVFSHNLNNGLFYNGIKSMHVQYLFSQNGKSAPLKQSYFTVKQINGLSKYNDYRQDHQDVAVNNERYVNRAGESQARRSSDHTGESVVAGGNNESEYVYPKSQIKQYKSKVLNDWAIGGDYGSPQKKWTDHSVVIKFNGNAMDMNLGSAVGYGSFNPLTKMTPPHNSHKKTKKQNIVEKATPIHKKSNKKTLTHPNEEFNYTINGQIPQRNKYNHRWRSTYYYWAQDSSGFSYKGKYYPPTGHEAVGHGAWQYYDVHASDHYNVDDTLPKEVSAENVNVTDDQGHNLPVSLNGNHISMHLNNEQLVEYSNDNFKINVKVKANNLPSNPSSNKWYVFWNQAHANEDVYQGHDDTWDDTGKTKSFDRYSTHVPMRIRQIKYHSYNYDYDGDDENDNDRVDNSEIPSSQGGTDSSSTSEQGFDSHDDYGGHNNQFNKKFIGLDGTIDDDLQIGDTETHYGYEGQRVTIHLPTNATDGAGHRYRYAYGEGVSTIHPILGGFDENEGKYHEGHINQGTDNGKKLSSSDDDDGASFNKNGYNGTLDTNTGEDKDDSARFTMKFYNPFTVPSARMQPYGRLMVNTDKQDNGLPFRLDLKSNSFRFSNSTDDRYYDKDFGGYKVNVNITSNGTNLYSKSVPFSDLFNKGQNAHKLTELFKGELHTENLPKQKKGAKIPLHVQVNFTDQNNQQADMRGLNSDSFAYISSENNMTGKDFKNGDKVKFKEPERTIDYFNNGNVRTQNEELTMKQNHAIATAKTGLGLRSNLELGYAGHINADAYGKNGTDTDYAFPSSWQNNDSRINYQANPYSDSNTDPSGNQLVRDANGNPIKENGHTVTMNQWDKEKREHADSNHEDPAHNDYSSYNNANLADRLEKVNHNFFENDVPSDLDNGTSDQKAVDNDFGSHISGLKSNGMPSGDTAGSYSTEFQFTPRKIVRDSGLVELQRDEDNDDGLNARNDVSASLGQMKDFFGNADDTISDINQNRMYTDSWLPLGNYNTVFEKAMPSSSNLSNNGKFNGQVGNDPKDFDDWYNNSDDKRLGGNFFNFEDNMFDQMVAHENLAIGSKSEPNDELSIQPVLGGSENTMNGGKNKEADIKGQNVKGFTKEANDWIQFRNGWQNFDF